VSTSWAALAAFSFFPWRKESPARARPGNRESLAAPCQPSTALGASRNDKPRCRILDCRENEAMIAMFVERWCSTSALKWSDLRQRRRGASPISGGSQRSIPPCERRRLFDCSCEPALLHRSKRRSASSVSDGARSRSRFRIRGLKPDAWPRFARDTTWAAS
jgi:hypothetical protein